MAGSVLLSMFPVFFLGAPDAEMEAIEAMLLAAGVPAIDIYKPVSGKDASRLAYGGWAIDPEIVARQIRSWGDCAVVLVECAPSNIFRTSGLRVDPSYTKSHPGLSGASIYRIDHHFPGDVGFGASPRLALWAASIGQIAVLLGVELTPEQQVVAVLDHCAAAACQGATQIPAEKAQQEYLSRLPESVRALVPEAIAALKAAPFAGKLRDLTSTPDLHPKGRLGGVLVAAALVSGEGYVGWGAQGDSLRDGVLHRHIGVGGFGEGTILGPIAIEDALSGFGAVGIYGDPVRGFGGGYVPLIRWAICHGPTASVIEEGLSPDFELDRDMRAALKAAEARAPLHEIDIRGGGRWMAIESPCAKKGQIFFGLTAYRRYCLHQEGQCRELTPVDGVVDTREEVLKLLPE